MKLNQLVWIGLSAFVVATAPVSAQVLTRSTPTVPMTQSNMLHAQITAIATGTFTAAEKPTTGTARIVQEGGQRYVELDGAFSTSDQGPDLHVLLDTAAQPPASYKEAGQTVNLGRLQSYSGAQRYAIPSTVDVSRYNSVVIWCQMANATFGYAPLHSAMGQAQPASHHAFQIDWVNNTVGL